MEEHNLFGQRKETKKIFTYAESRIQMGQQTSSPGKHYTFQPLKRYAQEYQTFYRILNPFWTELFKTQYDNNWI